MVEDGFPRLRLVRLMPAAWETWLASRPELAQHALLINWAHLGRPFIVRRVSPGESSGVPLALPLPPSMGMRGLTLNLSSAAIIATAPLPALTQVIDAAPPQWRDTLWRFDALAVEYGVSLRVHGSLAWRYLTDLPYVTPQSDLDLVWSAPGRARFAAFLEDVAGIAAQAPMPVDGEVQRVDGEGVHWRELHSGASQVAFKSVLAVRLSAVEELFTGVAP